MTTKEAAAWVDRYVSAWKSNAQEEIGPLFTEDSFYYPGPFEEPWQGRETIVRRWLERQDAPGTWEFRYEVLAASGDTTVVRGWTRYLDPPRAFSNLWAIRFAPDGRCREFTEWWIQQPEPRR